MIVIERTIGNSGNSIGNNRFLAAKEKRVCLGFNECITIIAAIIRGIVLIDYN